MSTPSVIFTLTTRPKRAAIISLVLITPSEPHSPKPHALLFWHLRFLRSTLSTRSSCPRVLAQALAGLRASSLPSRFGVFIIDIHRPNRAKILDHSLIIFIVFYIMISRKRVHHKSHIISISESFGCMQVQFSTSPKCST